MSQPPLLSIPCPDERTLAALLVGPDDPLDDDLSAIEEHVGACPTCQTRLKSLADLGPYSDHLQDAFRDLHTDLTVAGPGRQEDGPALDNIDGDRPIEDPTRRDLDSAWTIDSPDVPGLPGLSDLPSPPGFAIAGVIGRGGMGIVYRARQVGLNRVVALKTLDSAWRLRPERLARFRVEAETIAKLRHPNIVTIYEVGDLDGRPFFAMEYVGGGNLHERIGATPQDPRAAAILIAQLADAVQAAHDQGVVHRDLKPTNILLEPNGDPKARPGPDSSPGGLGRPLITDFGIAKSVAADAESNLTGTDEILGTPSYMAPERALPGSSANAASPAIDIYALGAILYELLTGRPPFQGTSPTDTLMLVLAREPVSPRRLQPKIPRDLETIALKCLQKSPKRRYVRAGDLADDLRRYQSGQPIEARPVPFWERLWLQARRRPLAASALTAVLLLAITLLVGWWRFTLELTEERNKAETERREAQFASLQLTITQAQDLCERGESGRGLIWYAEALRQIEGLDHPQASDLERVVRLNLEGWRHTVNPLVDILDISSSIYCLELSDDGRWLAVGSRVQDNPDASGLVAVWSRSDHRTEGDPWTIPHPENVRSLAMHPERPLLATSSEDGVVRTWDLVRRREAGSDWPLPTSARVVRFSPDGTQLVVGCSDGRIGFRAWDDADGPLRWLVDDEDPEGEATSGLSVHALAFHAERPWLLSASDNAVIRLWNLETGRPLARTPETPDRDASVRCLAWHPDGSRFATGRLDRRARQWQVVPTVDDGWRFRTWGPIVIHAGSIRSVDYDATGDRLLTGSGDGTVRVNDARTGEALRAPIRHQGGVRATQFLEGGAGILAAGIDGAVRSYRIVPEPNQEAYLPERVEALAFTPEGDRLVVALDDRAVHLLDAETLRPIGASMPHESLPFVLDLDTEGRRLITRSRDGSARLWDLATRRLIGDPRTSRDVQKVQFLGGTDQILIAQLDGGVGLWDPTDPDQAWTPIAKPIGVDQRILDASVHPDGRSFVALITARDRRVESTSVVRYRRTVEGWSEVGSIAVDSAVSVSHTPDGSRILTATREGLAQIRDAVTGEARTRPLEHQRALSQVAFSADGRFVATASRDQFVRLFDAETGYPVHPPIAHAFVPATAIAFHPDGTELVSGGGDFRLVRLALPRPIAGEADQIIREIERLTALRLTDDRVIRDLSPEEWARTE